MKGKVKSGVMCVLLLSLAVSLVLSELILRFTGYCPGKHSPTEHFCFVDTLVVRKGFESDSIGIMRIDAETRRRVWEMISHNAFVQDFSRAEPYLAAMPSISCRTGKAQGEIAHTYSKISSLTEEARTPIQQALIHFVDSAINTDGFRSIAFRPVENNKPSVLLLGDSFTYGHSASSFHNSFADLLLARGYTVYNTGITGADVAQYLAVARHWIPRLRPDVVIVNFYMGNDIAYFKREVSPDNPMFYPTNAGILMACPEGVQLKTAEEAYAVCMHWVGITPTRMFEKLMALTSLTSAIYGVLWRNGVVYQESDFIRSYNWKKQQVSLSYPYSRVELTQIDSIAKSKGARTIISVIPELRNGGEIRRAEDEPDAFEGIDFMHMEVTPDDYVRSDGHFNDRGHRRYADFLERIIDERE